MGRREKHPIHDGTSDWNLSLWCLVVSLDVSSCYRLLPARHAPGRYRGVNGVEIIVRQELETLWIYPAGKTNVFIEGLQGSVLIRCNIGMNVTEAVTCPGNRFS